MAVTGVKTQTKLKIHLDFSHLAQSNNHHKWSRNSDGEGPFKAGMVALLAQPNNPDWPVVANNSVSTDFASPRHNDLLVNLMIALSLPENSMFSGEHVFWSAFKTYPVRHLQTYESSVLTQMCWQPCSGGHESDPEKETLPYWTHTLLWNLMQSLNSSYHAQHRLQPRHTANSWRNTVVLTWACFLVCIQHISLSTFADVWFISADANMLAAVSLGTYTWTWKETSNRLSVTLY